MLKFLTKFMRRASNIRVVLAIGTKKTLFCKAMIKYIPVREFRYQSNLLIIGLIDYERTYKEVRS